MNALLEPSAPNQEQSAFSSHPIGLERVMSSVGRLAGAADVCLFRYCRETDRIEPIAGALPRLPATTTPFHATLAGDRGAAPYAGHAGWTDNPVGEGQVLLVKLVDGLKGPVFLMLTPAVHSDIERAATLAAIPDVVVLIRYHLRFVLRLEEAQEMGEAAREALDHNECCVIAVRADHSIVFANAAGTAHLAEEVGLRLRRGVLRPIDHGKAIRFEAALDSVIDPVKVATGKRPRASVLLLDSINGGDPMIVVVAPAGIALPGGEARGAAAMVYVLPLAPGARRGLDTLCKLLGLSRVECSLITHLIEGLTLSEAAAKMQVKIDTARTYLKQIFVKTGMHRQADLVTMITRYLRAIRGNFDFQAA